MARLIYTVIDGMAERPTLNDYAQGNYRSYAYAGGHYTEELTGC